MSTSPKSLGARRRLWPSHRATLAGYGAALLGDVGEARSATQLLRELERLQVFFPAASYSGRLRQLKTALTGPEARSYGITSVPPPADAIPEGRGRPEQSWFVVSTERADEAVDPALTRRVLGQRKADAPRLF